MRVIVTLLLLVAATSIDSSAQTLPAPSRTVYKCNVNGKMTYSDVPCLGAERLEIEPSRGVGRTAGPDVQRERRREMFAEAIRPLTGMDAKQLDVHGRRMKLLPEAQRECRALDAQIPEAERAEARASAEQRDSVKMRLLTLRQRQHDLRC
jgi:hypothetical protein